MLPILYLIIPCYNEESVLPFSSGLFFEKLMELTERKIIHPDSRILFVDDGSTDRTWELICALARGDGHFLGIAQSRNRGHQNALLAGLTEAAGRCDITVSMDCDGQDDIDVLADMIREYQKGSEIVYGVRSDRSKDRFLKRFTAERFYGLLRRMGCEVIYNHADYRLVSARVLREFNRFGEVNLYLRGLFPLVGFPSSCVSYERKERIAGGSHYPLAKMLGLAADGITSLSIRPIRIITVLGLSVSCLSFLAMLWALITHICGHAVNGWTSTLCIVCLLSGVQLLSLGVIGEYVGKTYLEAKARPRFIIRARTYETEDAGRHAPSDGQRADEIRQEPEETEVCHDR